MSIRIGRHGKNKANSNMEKIKLILIKENCVTLYTKMLSLILETFKLI